MNKIILTPKLAGKIQKEIYYSMPAEKKVRITSQFFMLGKKLKESEIISRNESRRIINKNK